MGDGRLTDDRAVVALRKWAVLLDSAFQVPGTRMRFGLDPIVGLIPGVGDIITGFFSVMIVIHAVRLRIPPREVKRRMKVAGRIRPRRPGLDREAVAVRKPSLRR